MTLEFPNQEKLQTYLETIHPETKDAEDKKIFKSVAKIFANFKPRGSGYDQDRMAVSTKLGTVLYWGTRFEVVKKTSLELESTKSETSTNSNIEHSSLEPAKEKEKILTALMDCLYMVIRT